MKVVLTYCTPDSENVIATAAVVCYDGGISPEANSQRMDRLKRYNAQHAISNRLPM